MKRPSTRRPQHARQRGSSFAELMLATLIVGTTIVASISSMSESAEVYHFFSDGPHEALMLAQEIHEAALLLPWEAPAGADANFGPDVVTLWDLDEEEFDPPRSAEYEVILSHVSWEQHVEVRVVDADDPTVEVDPDTFEGETLTELAVTVFKGSGEAGTFKWWISEPGVDDAVAGI